MAKVIAVANQKGGVGKTTTSVNLAAVLGELGKKTLLVDMDAQGNATTGLGIEKKELSYSVYNVIVGEMSMEESIIKDKFENLSVCPSGLDLAGAEIELISIEDREFAFKNSLATVRDKYDYIIVDCPPSLGLVTLNCLTAADSVLIPLQCEYYALEGVSQLISTIKKIKKSLNPDIEIEGVLLTMLDSRTNLGIQVVEEVKRFFPGKVYRTIIPRNVRLSEAPSFGIPITKYDKNSRGAESYIALGKEVIERNL
ncbi:MAG: AAA family ATPase [Bacillota bacterium]|nr:AAA family ATPase [Bacillota bacterium]